MQGMKKEMHRYQEKVKNKVGLRLCIVELHMVVSFEPDLLHGLCGKISNAWQANRVRLAGPGSTSNYFSAPLGAWRGLGED